MNNKMAAYVNPKFIKNDEVYFSLEDIKRIYDLRTGERMETDLDKIKKFVPDEFIQRITKTKRDEDILTLAYERVNGYSPIVSIEETPKNGYVYASFYKKYIKKFYLDFYKPIIEDNYVKKYKLSVNEFIDIINSSK